jgi:hypothetical protein
MDNLLALLLIVGLVIIGVIVLSKNSREGYPYDSLETLGENVDCQDVCSMNMQQYMRQCEIDPNSENCAAYHNCINKCRLAHGQPTSVFPALEYTSAY